ncbi:MAG TPA: HlyD family efflux transporter periplasmic adaptor subunit [Solirubrobacter sp.]|nr:HlyD family efflux transporter periplasmic adaptor subunit [Solirubrobacter sp.]
MSAITQSLPFRGRSRRRGHPAALVALVALAGAAVAGAAASLASGGTDAPATVSRTATVSRGVVQSTVSGSGNLEVTNRRDLSFSTAGEIEKVYVAAGDKVTQGQALARLDPTDDSLDTTYLRAPFSGTVATVNIAVGDAVSGATSAGGTSSTSDTAAFELVQLTRYELPVSVSESDIGKVKVGQVATVTVSATGEKLSARVTAVGVDSTSSTSDATSSSSSAVAYPVTLELTQRSSKLKPGMTASADIVTEQASGVTVPTQALRGNTVTVVENGKQTQTRVETGIQGDSTTQIVSGLEAGDKVLVTSTSAAAGASATGTQTSQQQGGLGQGFSGGGGMPAGGPPSGFPGGGR